MLLKVFFTVTLVVLVLQESLQGEEILWSCGHCYHLHLHFNFYYQKTPQPLCVPTSAREEEAVQSTTRDLLGLDRPRAPASPRTSGGPARALRPNVKIVMRFVWFSVVVSRVPVSLNVLRPLIARSRRQRSPNKKIPTEQVLLRVPQTFPKYL